MGFFDLLFDSNITINDLENENLGIPQNPNIEINPTKLSDKIPQAWEYNGNWYYNFPGAIAEAKYLNKKIPTKNEWKQIIKSNDYEYKLPILGYTEPYGHEYDKFGTRIDHVLRNYDKFYIDYHLIIEEKIGNYWSSSKEFLCGRAFSFRFKSGTCHIPSFLYGCAMPVRCLKK